MIYSELHNVGRPLVFVKRDFSSNQGAWARIQEVMGRGVVGGDKDTMDVRVDVFLAELDTIRDIKRLFGESVELGPKLQSQLKSLVKDKRAREGVLETETANTTGLDEELKLAGFKRILKPFQLANIARILQLPHGADFSVPGAGKTTVGLANFALSKHRGIVQRLLVIAPISAFSAWKEDSLLCFICAPNIVVHGGIGSVIPTRTDILLTNYNRVAADYDQIRKFVADAETHIILDEAHRIKRGALGVHGRAVLDLAYAARRRDVLTGTPAPQGAHDLVALVSFLYPGQDRQIMPKIAYEERNGREENVLLETSTAIKKYFVRTTKSELELPPTKFVQERGSMGGLQQAIYSALIGRYRDSFKLETTGRREFDRLGRIMMYLLEAATNPMLLRAGSDNGDDPLFIHPPIELNGNEHLLELLDSYNNYETPWKYKRIAEIVAAATQRGEKVLIWSSFVRNLKALSKYLSTYNPAIVHGGIPSLEEPLPPEMITREREFNRFRYDSTCTVLLANPAACGEGVSLHHWCHHAIYLDRTFNAGQFLQSQDRIHRLGLADGTVTQFTLLTSAGTIDETVNGRLAEKVAAMATLMGDPGLVRLALPDIDSATSEGVEPALDDDLTSILAHLRNAP
ncbi:MAG: helicase [Herbaspirillum sp.]|nr:helicase [Herbaspirillum sp.]